MSVDSAKIRGRYRGNRMVKQWRRLRAAYEAERRRLAAVGKAMAGRREAGVCSLVQRCCAVKARTHRGTPRVCHAESAHALARVATPEAAMREWKKHNQDVVLMFDRRRSLA